MSSPAPVLPARASKGREPFVVFALVLTVVAIYGQTVGHPFSLLDDPAYVTANPQVRAGLTWAGVRWAWTTFQEGHWHPLTWLSLMLDAQIHRLNAGGYHLTNGLLHAGSAVLLLRWLRLTTKAVWLSALTALLFAAHPLHVASVAWVARREDVLGALFCGLTLLAYTRYAWGGFGRMRYFWLAWLFCALGLLAKPMLVTLPLLLLLLDYWPLRRFSPEAIREHWLRLVVEKVPFAALAAASCAMTFLAQSAQESVSFGQLTLGARMASAVLGVGTSLEKTFWPVNLGPHYPPWQGAPPWLPVLWAVVLAAVTAFTWRRWRRQPYLIVGWLWFLGMLVPMIWLAQAGGGGVADQHAYLPHVGLFVALCWAGRDVGLRWPGARPWLVGVAVVAVAACVVLSIRQAHHWRNDAALSGPAIVGGDKSPQAVVERGRDRSPSDP